MRARTSAVAALLVVAGCSSSSPREAVVTVAAPTTSIARAATTAATTTTATTVGTGTTAATSAAPTAAATTAAPPPETTAATAPPPPATPQLGAVAVTLTPVVALTEPIDLASRTGDDAFYVAERRGRIVRVAGGAVAETLLDMRGLTQASGERGLLGFAFSPDGARLYTSYTNTAGNSVVDEYELGSERETDVGSRRRVLTLRQPYANHNGGGIAFGPDGMLYIGFGDGGSANDPQRYSLNLSSWLGKMLRIDPRATDGAAYAVPADNPFLGDDGAQPEIWSYGLRNPWRFSFDAANGDLWIGDVGQGSLEEVDHAPAASGTGRGVNFGWSAFEGTNRFNRDQPADGHTPPVHEYGRGAGCSITGGFVYRGTAIQALRGAYVFADYCQAGVRAIDPADPGESVTLVDRPANVVSFGQGPGNELYVLSFDGNVYRLDAA